MRRMTAKLPSLAGILKEQLAEVSSLRPKGRLAKGISLMRAFLDDKPLSPSDQKEAEELVGILTLNQLLASSETLIVPDDGLSRAFKTSFTRRQLPALYEEFYAHQLLDALPDIARRAAKLRALLVERPPSAGIAGICREAYRSYIFGHFGACLAVLRCALESTLREMLQVDLGSLMKLSAAAQERQLYSPQIAGRVRRLARRANRWLHTGGVITENNALEMLELAQDVLQHLHRSPR